MRWHSDILSNTSYLILEKPCPAFLRHCSSLGFSVIGTVVSQAKQEGVLLSKFAMVSSAAPHLPLKQHFTPLDPCSMSSMSYFTHRDFKHRDLIKEWPTGQVPILQVCQLLNGPIQTHLERARGPVGLGLQILLPLVIPR